MPQIDSAVVSDRRRPASLNGIPVVAERRLRGGVRLVVLETPLAGNIWRILGTRRLGRQSDAEQRRGNEEKWTRPSAFRVTHNTDFEPPGAPLWHVHYGSIVSVKVIPVSEGPL